MDSYFALVVDDDKAVRAQALNANDPGRGITVLTAANLAEAREIVRGTFLNAAFVDMQLQEKIKNKDGMTILRELMDARPSCRRYLLTQYPDQYRKDFFDLLNPLNPIISGALDKYDFQQNLEDVLFKLAEAWRARPVVVENTAELHALLMSKKISSPGADLTVVEVDFAISSLLGQSASGKKQSRTDEDLDRIRLEPMGGGRSRSVVAYGRPRNALGRDGIYCVVKIGPRQEVEEEYLRYQRYVKFFMSLSRRVELLDYSLCDTLGAVCYSFAGASPSLVTSLADLIDKEGQDTFAAVEAVTESGDEWRKISRTEKDLAGYFSRTYGLDATRVLDEVRDFCERQAPSFGGKKVHDDVQLKGAKLQLPGGIMGAGALRANYRACVVHGDLNAENILVSNDGRVMCIDYRYTGWGPRVLDYVPLEASLRISKKSIANAHLNVVADLKLESEIWRLGWSGTPDPRASSDWPYWATASLFLIRLMRKQIDDVGEQEFAAVCLLWALRIFRVRSLTSEAHLRLLVWMSWLCTVLGRNT